MHGFLTLFQWSHHIPLRVLFFSYFIFKFSLYYCWRCWRFSYLCWWFGNLQTDQLETRLKAVNLVGNIIALPETSIAEAFQPILSEFLKRLTDRDNGVRLSVLEHVKSSLLSNPHRAEAPQIICKFIKHVHDIQLQLLILLFVTISTKFICVKLFSCPLRSTSGFWWKCSKASCCCYLWCGMPCLTCSSSWSCEACCRAASWQICMYFSKM